jgi:hypothetical protein
VGEGPIPVEVGLVSGWAESVGRDARVAGPTTVAVWDMLNRKKQLLRLFQYSCRGFSSNLNYNHDKNCGTEVVRILKPPLHFLFESSSTIQLNLVKSLTTYFVYAP